VSLIVFLSTDKIYGWGGVLEGELPFGWWRGIIKLSQVDFTKAKKVCYEKQT